eukprot:TRINITY_DN60914_c0_g1_i1.p1 TRINITY_DN60914_c0_g1~~TRINITY_DN60914_c0_g1_i1.p1  ORF type:complete len:590 (-),score=-17.63 TRINITY_DN60914_c0_g1_i1:92-1861(-)
MAHVSVTIDSLEDPQEAQVKEKSRCDRLSFTEIVQTSIGCTLLAAVLWRWAPTTNATPTVLFTESVPSLWWRVPVLAVLGLVYCSLWRSYLKSFGKNFTRNWIILHLSFLMWTILHVAMLVRFPWTLGRLFFTWPIWAALWACFWAACVIPCRVITFSDLSLFDKTYWKEQARRMFAIRLAFWLDQAFALLVLQLNAVIPVIVLGWHSVFLGKQLRERLRRNYLRQHVKYQDQSVLHSVIPTEVLDVIFTYLPIDYVSCTTLRRVCVRWCIAIEDILRHADKQDITLNPPAQIEGPFAKQFKTLFNTDTQNSREREYGMIKKAVVQWLPSPWLHCWWASGAQNRALLLWFLYIVNFHLMASGISLVTAVTVTLLLVSDTLSYMLTSCGYPPVISSHELQGIVLTKMFMDDYVNWGRVHGTPQQTLDPKAIQKLYPQRVLEITPRDWNTGISQWVEFSANYKPRALVSANVSHILRPTAWVTNFCAAFLSWVVTKLAPALHEDESKQTEMEEKTLHEVLASQELQEAMEVEGGRQAQDQESVAPVETSAVAVDEHDKHRVAMKIVRKKLEHHEWRTWDDVGKRLAGLLVG